MKAQIEQVKVDKGIHRKVMLEMGVYNIHKQKQHKDKKKYSRKEKHKGGWYNEEFNA